MSDESALVTVAMLSTLIKENHTDYLDIISPFIVDLLPFEIGHEVDTATIILGLKTQFGFEQFPYHVLMKIFTRLSKEKIGILKREHNKFYVKKSVSKDKFRANHESIQHAQNAVMESLQNYLQNNSKYTKINLDDVREKFLVFLEKKGLVFIDGVDELKSVTNRDYDAYQVARFVLEEKEKCSTIFSQIEEVVRGFFVYKSIYFFNKDSQVSISSKMNDTIVYFDTPLLIEALGYNTTEGEIATRELIQLIKSSGGHVKTFNHLVDELAGILTAFAREKTRRYSFSLQNLYDRNYDETDIIRLRQALTTNLGKIGIDADKAVEITDYANDEYSKLRINDLTAAIQLTYKQEFQSNRSDNDVRSVVTIHHLRGLSNASSLSDCVAVMATSNLGFVNTVRDFYRDDNTSTVCYTIGDFDLTSVLWLRSWNNKSSLPRIILLENAYAACQPSYDLMSVFSQTVEKLRNEGEITDDEALLLRTQRAPRDELLERSGNDPAYVSDKTVLDIKQKYEELLVGSRNNEIEQLKEEVRLEKQRTRDRERAQRTEALTMAETKAKNASNKTEKHWKITAIIITIILLCAGLFALIYTQFQADMSLIWKIALSLIGIVGFIDSIRSRNGLISRFIQTRKRNTFDSAYAKEVDQINKIFYGDNQE